VTDAMQDWLNRQRPWRPEYVPWADRPNYMGLAMDHAVAAGHHAFYIDPEVGSRGVFVAWATPTLAGVQFNLAVDEDREQRRRGDRNTWVVPTADLRDTWELAGLAAHGRKLAGRSWAGPRRLTPEMTLRALGPQARGVVRDYAALSALMGS
jgi:hypothetical protein